MAKPQVKRDLNARQMKGAYLYALGYKNIEIAKECKVSNNTLTKWVQDERFQAEVEKLLRKELKSLARKAMRNLNSLLDSSDEKIALATSKTVLDKAGYATKTEQEITGNQAINISFSYEDESDSDDEDLEDSGVDDI